MKPGGAAGAVVASSQLTVWQHGFPDAIVSLGVGLIGVALARWVFVGRENRRLGTPQRWNDTLPLTLVAMLVAGVVIYDRDLGLSAAAFTGLGVGWAAVLLLDVMGERVTSMLRAGFAVPVPPSVTRIDVSGHDGKILDEVTLPEDMTDQLRILDEFPGTDPAGGDGHAKP